jgi:membrane-associated phospholipid phosphatase
MKRMDAGGNACPSLHAAFCVFTALALHAQLKSTGAARWLLACNALWCLGILYSTMATRQHVALDVVAGVVLGGAAAIAYLGALGTRARMAHAPAG